MPVVRGNALIAVVDLNAGGGIKDFYFLANEAVRYTVVMLVRMQTRMAVHHHRDNDLLLELVAVRRQGLERFFFNLFEPRAPAVIPCFKGCVARALPGLL